MHDDVECRIVVLHRAKHLIYADFRRQLLANLPLQRIFGSLTRLHLPTGKLPSGFAFKASLLPSGYTFKASLLPSGFAFKAILLAFGKAQACFVLPLSTCSLPFATPS